MQINLPVATQTMSQFQRHDFTLLLGCVLSGDRARPRVSQCQARGQSAPSKDRALPAQSRPWARQCRGHSAPWGEGDGCLGVTPHLRLQGGREAPANRRHGAGQHSWVRRRQVAGNKAGWALFPPLTPDLAPGRGAEEPALLPTKEGLRQRTRSECGGALERLGLPKSLSHNLRQLLCPHPLQMASHQA